MMAIRFKSLFLFFFLSCLPLLSTSASDQDKKPAFPNPTSGEWKKICQEVESILLPLVQAKNIREIAMGEVFALCKEKNIGCKALLEHFIRYLEGKLKASHPDFKKRGQFSRFYPVDDLYLGWYTPPPWYKIPFPTLKVPTYYPDSYSRGSGVCAISGRLSGALSHFTRLEGNFSFYGDKILCQGDGLDHFKMRKVLTLLHKTHRRSYKLNLKIIEINPDGLPKSMTSLLQGRVSQKLLKKSLYSYSTSLKEGKVKTFLWGKEHSYLASYSSAPKIKSQHFKPMVKTFPEGLWFKGVIHPFQDQKKVFLQARFHLLEGNKKLRNVQIPGLGPLELPRQHKLSLTNHWQLSLSRWTLLGRGKSQSKTVALVAKIEREASRKEVKLPSPIPPRLALRSLFQRFLDNHLDARYIRDFLPGQSSKEKESSNKEKEKEKNTQRIKGGGLFGNAPSEISDFPEDPSQRRTKLEPLYFKLYYMGDCFSRGESCNLPPITVPSPAKELSNRNDYSQAYDREYDGRGWIGRYSYSPDKIVEMIKGNVGEEYFLDDERFLGIIFTHWLFVAQTRKVHRKIKAVLQGLRKINCTTASYHLTVLHFQLDRPSSLSKMDPSGRKMLTSKDLKAFLKKLSHLKGGKILNFSSLRGRRGQELKFFSGIEENYLFSYRLFKKYEKKSFPLKRGEPVIQTLSSGLFWKAKWKEGKKAYLLEFKTIQTKRERLRQISTQAGPLELPHVSQMGFSGRLLLEKGGGVLWPGGRKGEFWLVIFEGTKK